MKNSQSFHPDSEWKGLKKLLLIMKLSFLLLFFTCLQLSAVVNSQTVSLTVSDAPMNSVLKEFHDQTGYNFFYDDELLRKAGKVNIDLKDVPIEVALEECFGNLPIDYEIVDNTIVLRPRPGSPDPAVAIQKQEPLRLTGTVKDKNGNPLESAAVVVKGTSTGTSTDAEGNFVLSCPADSKVLQISILGMKTQEIVIGGQTIFNVILEEVALDLDEVQVVAYGKTTRRLNTGAVSSIKAENIAKQPFANFAQALQGQMTGVVVTNSEGSVGSGVSIQIRGLNSFGSGTSPLYIVDGVIINSSNSGAVFSSYVHGTSVLNSINPNDIASIDILKDADATAIYGSRGTNGVVLITTKRAQLGKTRVNIDMNTGFNKATYMPEMLSTDQYVALRKEAYTLDNRVPTESRAADLTNLPPWEEGANTDWTKYELDNKAPVTNISADISGGDKALNYYFSTGYLKQYDIQPGDPNQERIGTRLNVHSLGLNDRLETDIAMAYSIDKLKPTNVATNNTGGVRFLPPNFPLYNDNGDYYWGSSTAFYYANPEASMTRKTESANNNFLGSANLGYEVYKGLKVKAAFAYNNQSNEAENIFPSSAVNPYSTITPNASSSFSNYTSMNFEPQLTYNGKISNGIIDVLLGSTWFQSKSSSKELELIGFPGDDFMESWTFADDVTTKSSSESDGRYRSYFARVNYNWNEKYIVNLSYRRDGSSKFGPNYKWGDFGAAGVAWIFSNESFIKDALPFLSFGKLRTSYGITGNDQIADYQYLNLYTADNVSYGTSVGLQTQYLYNEDIHWEKTNKLEAALEFGLFSNRIGGSVSWYRNMTTDFLVSEPIASQTGFSAFVNNFDGIVQNTGWEFELRTVNIMNDDFQWRTNINFTIAKNSLYEYDDLENSVYSDQYEIGQPLDIIRSYYVDSISTVNGYAVFRDVNNDGQLTSPADRVTLGSPTPRSYGGMENQFTYKNIDLGFTITAAQQMVTNWYFTSSLPGRQYNMPTLLLGNYWQEAGDKADYPRPTTGLVSNANVRNLGYTNTSNMAYNDVLWFRLSNVSLRYTLPATLLEKAGIGTASVYARAQNLMFWSPVDLGKDPQARGGGWGVPLQTWVFGIQLSF
jgi:TonB-linked SusC/RagA family outer membrane protein